MEPETTRPFDAATRRHRPLCAAAMRSAGVVLVPSLLLGARGHDPGHERVIPLGAGCGTGGYEDRFGLAAASTARLRRVGKPPRTPR